MAIASSSVERPEDEHPQVNGINISLNLCVELGTNGDECPPGLAGVYKAYVPYITYNYGQMLNGSVEVTPVQPAGTLTYTANGVIFCTVIYPVTVPCPAGSANFAPGMYTLYAYYNPGDGSAPTQSLPVVVTVLQSTVEFFTLTSSMNPAPVGTAVTFTASVVGTYGVDGTGTVVFTDGSTLLGSGALDKNGNAQITTATLVVGTHLIRASYPGSAYLAAPPDAELSQVILPPITTTTLTSSVNPSALGQNVTFTASVTSSSPGLHPAGAVSFNDGAKTFATVLVAPQGIAPTSISTLASGTHNITANYSGDAATGPSSAALVQYVDYPLTQAAQGFTVTVSPSPVVLGVGLTANLTVTVTPQSGFSEPVTLTCGDLPHESTCTFGESVVPAGGGTTTLDLHVTSPHDCGSTTPYFYGANRPVPGGFLSKGLHYGGTVLTGVLLLSFPRRRRWHNWQKGLLALCMAIGVAGLSGCSSACTDFGTYPGSYTFQVIGTGPAAISVTSTGSGASLVVPTSVGLTVKI